MSDKQTWVLIHHHDNGVSEIVDKHKDKQNLLIWARQLAQETPGVSGWTIAPESQAHRYISAKAEK